MTLTYAQGHRVMRKIDFVRSFYLNDLVSAMIAKKLRKYGK